MFNATRLRDAIAEQGLTQEKLARACGVSLGTVQKWCSGASSPKGDSLVRMSRELDRDPSWFYDDLAPAA